MDKKEALDRLSGEIEKCGICSEDSSGKAVFGEGDANAKIVFVGEAPGKEEAKTGRPFVGRSGQFLRSLISRIGLKESEIYITSPVKYLPNKGTPTKKQIEHSRGHFLRQLEIINPKLIVLLGATAALATLNEKIPVNKRHGQVIERDSKYYFLTFHPAAPLRFPPLRKTMEQDFQKLGKLVKKVL